jgi:hypothetical protein
MSAAIGNVMDVADFELVGLRNEDKVVEELRNGPRAYGGRERILKTFTCKALPKFDIAFIELLANVRRDKLDGDFITGAWNDLQSCHQQSSAT